MSYGKLKLTLPNGTQQEVSLLTPTLTIGTNPSNRLMLDYPGIDSRHARLTIEGNILLIEDLGSRAGVRINNQLIPAYQPSVIMAGKLVQVGSVAFVYEPTPVNIVADQTKQARQGLSIKAANEADNDVIHIDPQHSAFSFSPGNLDTLQLTIHNPSDEQDEFRIRISGRPAAWAHLDRERVILEPGQSRAVTITFQPPQSPQLPAGKHRVTFSAISTRNRVGKNTDTIIDINPYSSLNMRIEETDFDGRYLIVLQNLGNSAARYELVPSDAENTLAFRFDNRENSIVTISPGQTLRIPLEVEAADLISVGIGRDVPFIVTATPLTSGAEERTARSSLGVYPAVPRWIALSSLGLVTCLCLGFFLAYSSLLCTRFAALPFCPEPEKPNIVSFVASPLTVESGQPVALAWNVVNANVITINPEPGFVEAAQGGVTVNPTGSTSYVIEAANDYGSTTQQVIVEVTGQRPVVNFFKADPPVYIEGQQQNVFLSWNVPGAVAVQITGPGVDPERIYEPAATIELPNVSEPREYKLIATNDVGTAEGLLNIVPVPANCTVNAIDGTSLVDLESGPDASYANVAAVPSGSSVKPIGRINGVNWVRVQVGNETGWLQNVQLVCDVDLNAFPTVLPQDVPLLPATPTPTNTNTPLPTFTFTPSPVPTDTPIPTSTFTALPPTDTPTPTATLEPSAIPTATDTPTPTPTATLVPTATPATNFAVTAPNIDGSFSLIEWGDSSNQEIVLPNGIVNWTNDNNFLYLLVDVTADEVQDAPQASAPFGDDVWLFFDVNDNQVIDFARDIRFTRTGERSFFEQDGYSVDLPSNSQIAPGFGATPANTTPHRYWEVAISLVDIEAAPGQVVHMGIRVMSDNPTLDDELPENAQADFTDYITLQLAVGPTE